MSELTPNLKLFKYNTETDAKQPFSINDCMNANWDKIDASLRINDKLTNCLLEVPQRIKLELNNGTLTLKTGSQVIVPNGFESDGTTPKFDYVTIESDFTKKVNPQKDAVFTLTYGKNLAWALGNVERFDFFTNGVSMHSGSTAPTTTELNNIWYDTSTNKMKSSNDTGKTWVESDVAFPICMFKVTNLVISSIDQVFNGIGYIGSTVWVDKGVKGLIPNGRNEDGTLRNIEYVTANLITRTYTDNGSTEIAIRYGDALTVYGYFTVSDENYLVANNGDKVIGVSIASVYMTNNIITSFNRKQPFRAVDYNDYHNKSEIISWCMPDYQNKISFSISSSFTAPANGYIFIRASQSGGNSRVTIKCKGVNFTNSSSSIGSGTVSQSSVFFKISKGETISQDGPQMGTIICYFIPLKGGQ